MTETRKEDADSTVNSPTRRYPTSIPGRTFYTKDEDQAIKQYVDLSDGLSGGPGSISGNMLWKEMERKKITNRSWSSMRDRYLKHISKKPDSYFQSSQGEPDSSGAILCPAPRKSSLKFINPPHETSPYFSTHRRVRIKTAARSETSSDDDTPKRPDAPSVLVQEPDNFSPAVRTQDIARGQVSNENNEMSDFDEYLLNLAESVIDTGNSRTVNETDTLNWNIKEGYPSEDIPAKSDICGCQSDTGSNTTEDEIIKEGQLNRVAMKVQIDKLSPEQLTVINLVSSLRCQQNATLAHIMYSLFSTNACLDDATAYLVNGDTENVWTFHEDQILLGHDEEAIVQLAESRGIDKVENRILFLGYSSDSEDELPSDRDIEFPPDSEVEFPPDSEVELPPNGDVELPTDRDVEMPPDSEVELPPDSKELPPDRDVELPPDGDVELPPDRDVELPPDRDVELPPDRDVELPSDRDVELPPDRDVELSPDSEVTLSPDCDVQLPPDGEL